MDGLGGWEVERGGRPGHTGSAGVIHDERRGEVVAGAAEVGGVDERVATRFVFGDEDVRSEAESASEALERIFHREVVREGLSGDVDEAVGVEGYGGGNLDVGSAEVGRKPLCHTGGAVVRRCRHRELLWKPGKAEGKGGGSGQGCSESHGPWLR